MCTISLPHAFTLSFLFLAIPINFPATTAQLHATFHSLPYFSVPTHSPSPAPSHQHNHHHHHINHHVNPPAHSPTSYPSKPPTSPPLLHARPPTQPPVKPPSKAPAPAPAPAPHNIRKPPTKAPALAPYSNPPRKFVAVEGLVYCKNCSYGGVNTTIFGASPLSGAMVELRCKNTKYLLKKTATTDKNGYFFLQAPKFITTYGAHKCLVFLVQRPKNSTGGACSHATNLNGGVSGAFLFLGKTLAPPTKPLPFSLFTVGPFAFETPKCYEH